MWQALCRNFTYPLWDLKDGRGRLSELRSLKQSQHWDGARLKQLQLERLRSMVAYAYEHCEFYKRRASGPPRIDRIEDILAIPILSKADISGQELALLSSQFDQKALIGAKTGGSTGVALRVFFDETCQKKRNAAAMRTDGWAGWEPGALIGALWGTPPIPVTPKEKLRNLLHDRVFYLDTMRLDAATMGEFATQIRRRRPPMLFGHAHSLFIFARFLRDTGQEVPRMRGIISTSMMLIESERRVIEQVFGCAVTNRYGCEEVGLIASECEVHHGMHLNSEHVLVEFVLDDGRWAAPGQEGRIVVTDLINHGMPLIRYAVGDLGVPSDRACQCGRGLPLMEALTGRSADFLRRRDGSMVAGISLVEKTLTAIKGIEQLQIIQNRLDEFVLNVVPAPHYNEDSERELRQVMHEVFGSDSRIEVAKVERLSQERNSKYRFSICRI
jgi:phenylacetate-coenzyme A ligase PaaK-like adenylate-forming protein